MNEADWLAAKKAEAMLKHLRTKGQASERQCRLFACACARQVWNLLRDERSRTAVQVAEDFIDGLADTRQLHEADVAAWDVVQGGHLLPRWHGAAMAAASAARVVGDSIYAAAYNAACAMAQTGAKSSVTWAWQSNLLRCIVGNPFHPRPAIPLSVLTWNDGTVVKIAQHAYDDLDWSSLPILADALEDAGCLESSILQHLRGEGPHARGCHVLDEILRKE